MPLFVLLWTDAALLVMLALAGFYIWRVRRSPSLRATWARVAEDTPAMCAAVVLSVFVVIGVLDSVHYRPQLPPVPDAPADTPPAYSPITLSAMDALAQWVAPPAERGWSAPLQTRLLLKETELVDDQPVRHNPRLLYGGVHLTDEADHGRDLLWRTLGGLALGVVLALLVGLLLALALARCRKVSLGTVVRDELAARGRVPWRAMWITASILCLLLGLLLVLGSVYHVLGTDRTGNNVLLQSLKSVRTALIIGTLTTLTMLPLAIGLGLIAGYFRGWVDDIVQYIYTTLTSIPGVLLIAACVLMLQVVIDNNPDWFATAAQRADVRLFMLCLILGLTGWAGLCRLLRAEAMKLRELEYVQAARAFGVGHLRIVLRHLLPNVMHLVLITAVLEFSSLVLYEAVLSYLGVGVDPTMSSFGSMIDMARFEMARDPMVWWSLLSAFVFLVALVLSANLLADAVREAFDPRSHGLSALRRLRQMGSRA